MKKIIMVFVCLMTMVTSVNAHNVHYPTYTEDGITYIQKASSNKWDIAKVDKPNAKTIILPSTIMINGENIEIDTTRDSVFATCTSLDSLIVSDGLYLGENTFLGCKKLEYMYYSSATSRWYNNDVHYYKYRGLQCKTLETSCGVWEDSFWEGIKNSLEKLIIRETSTIIHTRMDDCTKLKTIICYATTPPSSRGTKSYTGYSCLYGEVKFKEYQWSTITLYVPIESLESYYFHSVWGEIDNIYPIDEMETETTAINSPINSAQMAKDVWYSLNGTKVEKPTKGIFIKNGKK